MNKKKKDPTNLKSVSKCRVCPLLGDEHVPSYGSPFADVMFIGPSPSEQEVVRSMPFIGPCGELLDLMLDSIDMSREEVYVANALKCRPPGSRKAVDQELSLCYETWLKHEIKIVDPKVIVLLGKDAFLSIVPKKKHDQWGHLNIIKTSKRRYLVTYHPSYFLRRGQVDEFLKVGSIIKEIVEEE